MAYAQVAMAIASLLQQKQQAEAAKRERAAAIRYSPWNKLSEGALPQQNRSDPAGTLSQAYGSYKAGEQNKALLDSQNKLRDAQIAALNRSNGGMNQNIGMEGAGSMGMEGSGSMGPWESQLYNEDNNIPYSYRKRPAGY